MSQEVDPYQQFQAVCRVFQCVRPKHQSGNLCVGESNCSCCYKTSTPLCFPHCFLLQCKNLPANGTCVRSRSWWALCWPCYEGWCSHLGRALRLCFCTWPSGKPWWCHQWQFNKCPLFSPSGALLKSAMSQDQVLQSLPFSQSLLIVQNRVISLWPDGRWDWKSFPIDYLMVLWLESCLEISGRFPFLSSHELAWVGLKTSSDLLDTCLSCCTCPKNIWGICSFLFVKSPIKKPTLRMPTNSGTTSEAEERNTRFENSCINPGLQATEQHQDFAVFARGCVQKLIMLTRSGSEWSSLVSCWHLKARLQSLMMGFSPVFRHPWSK